MGKDPKTTIEINGKRYDTRTGRELSVGATQPAKSNVVKKQVMSDVSRRSSTLSKSVHRPAERSQTLMRSAVKKPAGSKVSRSKSMMDVLSPITSKFDSNTRLQTKQDTERSKRAGNIHQSDLVARFNLKPFSKPSLQRPAERVLETPVTKRVEPLAVQPHPAAARASATSRPSAHNSQSVLSKGLQNANSHLEKPHKVAKKHARGRKFASMGASALALLLLVGFFTLQNAPNLSLRYAATRAGVHASMPGYHPAGFAINNTVQYSPGAVTISFRSNTDTRAYEVTQKNSNWDSNALMSNYLVAQGDTPQTVLKGGRTIYLYGDSNATWVNGGVWYNITGASRLNTDQLLDIASSI